MRAQQKQEDSDLQYIGRRQPNVTNGFPKHAEANRQDLVVYVFCHGIGYQYVARLTAIQANVDDASALRIAASSTDFVKEHRYPNALNQVGVGTFRSLPRMTLNKATLNRRYMMATPTRRRMWKMRRFYMRNKPETSEAELGGEGEALPFVFRPWMVWPTTILRVSTKNSSTRCTYLFNTHGLPPQWHATTSTDTTPPYEKQQLLLCVLTLDATIATGSGTSRRFAIINPGEANVFGSRTKGYRLGNFSMMAPAMLPICLSALTISPLQQSSAVKENHLLDEILEEATLVSLVRRCNTRGKSPGGVATSTNRRISQRGRLCWEKIFTRPVVNLERTEGFLATHYTRQKKTLSWVPVRLQDRTVWALLDTGANRNLMSDWDYEGLPQEDTLRRPETMMGAGGTKKKILRLGWITLRFSSIDSVPITILA